MCVLKRKTKKKQSNDVVFRNGFSQMKIKRKKRERIGYNLHEKTKTLTMKDKCQYLELTNQIVFVCLP